MKNFMRAAVVVGAMLVAGCADPIEQSGAKRWDPSPTQAPGARWTDRITVDDDGGIAAPGFNAHIDTTAPGWAEVADSTLVELLDFTQQLDGPINVFLRREHGDDEPVLTATRFKLGDDSIKAMRYRIVLRRAGDGRFRFVEGKLTIRCQPGRGHQTFETGNCS